MTNDNKKKSTYKRFRHFMSSSGKRRRTDNNKKKKAAKKKIHKKEVTKYWMKGIIYKQLNTFLFFLKSGCKCWKFKQTLLTTDVNRCVCVFEWD